MDIAEIDEDGKGLLFYGSVPVEICQKVPGQKNIFFLQITIELERPSQLTPKPGQFYLIRSEKSAVNYNRPISVFHAEEWFGVKGCGFSDMDGECDVNDLDKNESCTSDCDIQPDAYTSSFKAKKKITVQFLILEKGRGTSELCHMNPGDSVTVIGPLGTPWPSPEVSLEQKTELNPEHKNKKVCIVGAGIGVAPVANLAGCLAPGSYDFFACFRSGTYGLENIHPENLYVTTDDGSAGIKGMLPDSLTREVVKAAGYGTIYACGPVPALAYVKKLAAELGIKCWISMEHRMLCGLGACLGCTIETTQGLKRCCKDGPVFDAAIIEFPKPSGTRITAAGSRYSNHASESNHTSDSNNIQESKYTQESEPDIGVNIAGVQFKNPVIASAGTFAYGQNFRGVSDVKFWGGIASKGCTLEPREGNYGQRCLEVPGGNMNSIGLQNPGIPYFVENLLPAMMELGPVVIANLAGSDIESYVEGAKLLDQSPCHMIELNISCPNIKAKGLAWGLSADTAYYCVSSVRAVTTKPLIVKLSPNAPDNRPIAIACIQAGADALSMINMVHGVAIDIEKAQPFFNNVHAGYSGPGLKPLALRIVYDVVEEINKLPVTQRVPVIGIGGICTWQDAVEFIMAGAHAVQIGQAKFTNPNVALDVTTGLKNFMKSHGYKNLQDMRGLAQKKHSSALGPGNEKDKFCMLKNMMGKSCN